MIFVAQCCNILGKFSFWENDLHYCTECSDHSAVVVVPLLSRNTNEKKGI